MALIDEAERTHVPTHVPAHPCDVLILILAALVAVAMFTGVL